MWYTVSYFYAKSEIILLHLFLLVSFHHPFYSLDTEIESAYRDVFTNDLGYTLIGVKPVSIDELQYYYLHINSDAVNKFIESLKNIFKDSNEYIFKVFPFTDDYYSIELVNRKSVRAIASRSNYLKKFIKCKFRSTDSFISKIEDPNSSIFDIGDSVAVGILFGYGEESAKHFCRFCSLGEYLRKRPFVRWHNSDINIWTCLLQNDLPGTICFPYTIRTPKPNLRFDSLESEWEWLKSVDWDLFDMVKESAAKPPYFINLPYYRCRRSPGSYALRAKYMQARERLAKVFQCKSYQKAVEDIAK